MLSASMPFTNSNLLGPCDLALAVSDLTRVFLTMYEIELDEAR